VQTLNNAITIWRTNHTQITTLSQDEESDLKSLEILRTEEQVISSQLPVLAAD